MRILLLVFCALLAGCQQLPPLPAGQDADGIVDLRSGARLTPEQLVRELAGADLILVGERHDNPDHHALQRWLLEALAPGALLLEMLNPEQQARVDQARVRLAGGDRPTDLPEALAWQPGWDWEQYGELVSYALEQPWPLLAANLDRAEILEIYRNPPVLEGPSSAAAPVRAALEAQIRQSHCDMLPESQVPAMRGVQQQRDRRMAQRLLQAPRPAWLFAGAFHVRRDLGVPLHLRDLGASGAVLVLMLAEEGVEVSGRQADLLWRTPARPGTDHCAEWREQRQAQAKKDPASAGSKP